MRLCEFLVRFSRPEDAGVLTRMMKHCEGVFDSIGTSRGRLLMNARARLIGLLIAVSLAHLSCGGGGSSGVSAGSSGGTGGGTGGTTTKVTVSGVITVGAETPGLKVELRQNGSVVAATTADAVTGQYSIAQVSPGTYDLVPALGVWTFSPASRSVTVASADLAVADFAVASDSIGNTEAEVDVQDASLLAEPYPGFPALAVRRLDKSALAAPAAGPDRLTWLIDTMLASAQAYMCNRTDSPPTTPCTTWILEAGSDPSIAPKQTHLAYVWGSETPSVRRGPDPGGVCPWLLQGLDCNGMIYKLANDASIPLSAAYSAWPQGDPENWSKHIPPDWGVRATKVVTSSYKKGDLLVWGPNNAHIGIAEADGADPWVYSSTGGKLVSCSKNFAKGPRPVRASKLKDGVMPDHVVRFVADPVYFLNTKTSWRPKYFDYDTYTGPVVSVTLASLNDGKPIPAGSFLELTPKGQWTYSGSSIANGAAGRLLAGGSVVQPALGSTTVKGGVPADCKAGPDPYPDDFILFDGTTHKVVLPQGATTLELAVDDCVMWDNNPVPADPIRVQVKLVLPP